MNNIYSLIKEHMDKGATYLEALYLIEKMKSTNKKEID